MDENIIFEMPRNFSYENDYHQLYYYPKLILNRLRSHRSQPTSSEVSLNRTLSGSLPSLNDSSSATFEDNITQKCEWELVEVSGDIPKYRLRRMSSVSTDDVSFACSSTESARFKQLVNNIQKLYNKSRTSSVRPVSEDDIQQYFKSNDKSNEKSNGIKERSKTTGHLDATTHENFSLIKRASSLRSVSVDESMKVRSRKKSVRFADSLGLELQTVKRITGSSEQPPIIDSKVFEGLRRGVEEANRTVGIRHVCLCFKPPGEQPNFLKRVISNRVVLESCVIGPLAATVTGTIRVMNLCFRKDVLVRYSMNNWITFNDINASYVIDFSDNSSDRFAFTITLPAAVSMSSKLIFAIKYTAVDLSETYWDNNNGKNYELECCAKVVPLCESDSAWIHFL